MGHLTRRHVVFLYALESILFTLWPYVASDSILSMTNLIAPIALLGVGCLLYSYVRLCIHGQLSAELCWWQYTTTARKIAALSYWSSPVFVALLLLCTGLVVYVRGKRTETTQSFVCYLKTPLHVIDCVFTAYVIVAAIANQAALYVFVYLLLYIFLFSYSEIAYMATHIYFLALFCTLY